MEFKIRIRFGLLNRIIRCPAKSKKVQVFDEVIKDLASIQSNGSPTRPVFVPNHPPFNTVTRRSDRHGLVRFEPFEPNNYHNFTIIILVP